MLFYDETVCHLSCPLPSVKQAALPAPARVVQLVKEKKRRKQKGGFFIVRFEREGTLLA